MISVKSLVANWLNQIWYGKKQPPLALILLSTIYRSIVRLRRCTYQYGLLTVHSLAVPVIVVGNLTVGGSGKTPLTIWLALYLKKQGFKPGIVSRGYGGHFKEKALEVFAHSDFREIGDEALVITRHSQCPMFVGQNRADAANALLKSHDCDVIISDDGLQHYSLSRHIEIAVVDGARRFGNGYCLPAGPLREPLERIKQVDLVLYNGPSNGSDYSMTIRADSAINLKDNSKITALSDFAEQTVHVISGIGNPKRFYDLLNGTRINFDFRQFPDHHIYNKQDIHFADENPVLMTEKDAVKCQAFANDNHWYVPARAEVNENFGKSLLTLLSKDRNGQ